MHNDVERILFSEEQLKKAAADLGKRISAEHAGKKLLFIGILKGSIIFMADLMRSIDLECEIDFMVAKSYGNAAVSSGNVEILKDVSIDVKGKDVILIDDILDSGRTLTVLREHIMKMEPARVQICALLDKVNAPKYGDAKADYKGFDIENEFVVGYGLDYAERYRELPYIGVLKRSVYEK